ncbi:MAG: c-type cytochrome [Acidocella sp.]|nr:c-type cytochrome [Acidocella sp.]
MILTAAQVEQTDAPIDWFPNDHPRVPAIVGGPLSGNEIPCAECHALNGAGYPGSADLAGLPATYIVQQVMAFRAGTRHSAMADQPDTTEMIMVAQAVTPRQLHDAADYFAKLPRKNWVRVIETATVPRTIPDKYGWLDPAPGGGTEPIGNRVVELSDDIRRAFLGDDHVVLTDYAPPGAVARGRPIVTTGGGNGVPCAACHGVWLQGTMTVPPLAGRPAGYIARTMWDIRVGARGGPSVAIMRAQVGRLSPSEIRDVAAYLASLNANAPTPKK